MSDSQNPWNPQPQQPQPSRPQFQQPQQFGDPAQRPPQFSSAGQQPRPTSSGPQPPLWSSQPTPTPQPQQPRKTGGARRVAAVVGIVALAVGAGAGGGIVADRYFTAPDQASASATTDPGSEATTVVQADPNAPDWVAVADVASQSVVAIQVATASGAGQGSGVVIDTDGNIITNNHVVNGAEQILVTLGSRTFEAELVGTDPATDLAVIRMTTPPDDLTPMAIGDSNALVVGDPVMAIGNPLGLSGTVTTGIVSALDRPVTTQAVGSEDRDTVVTAAIQTNAAINPGNSGGALVNSSGELVGITTSIAALPGSSSGGQSGNIGIGFAIGSDQAQHVAEQLIANGVAQHPQVGVSASDVRQVGPMGARVVSVVQGSPADQAGLQEGDVITAVNDRSIASTSQLVGVVRAQEVGEEITVTYVRGGVEDTVALTTVAAPQ